MNIIRWLRVHLFYIYWGLSPQTPIFARSPAGYGLQPAGLSTSLSVKAWAKGPLCPLVQGPPGPWCRGLMPLLLLGTYLGPQTPSNSLRNSFLGVTIIFHLEMKYY